MNNRQFIKFGDNTRLARDKEATYLGNVLNDKASVQNEVNAKLQLTKLTWMKMQLFWKNDNDRSSIKWKIIVYDAVIRSKLLYGLETVHLTKSLCKKIDAFHLRGLRKILNIPTTFIDRSNTNQYVINKANEAMNHNANNRTNRNVNGTVQQLPNKKQIVLFSDMLKNKRMKLAEHIIRAPSSDPLRQVTYEMNTAKPKQYGKRRIGGPKQQWVYQTNKMIYECKLKGSSYDDNDVDNQRIYDHAWTTANRTIPIPNQYNGNNI